VSAPATVVLVHGAWHGAWCWDRVRDQLAARGVATTALDLPGHGDDAAPLTDLDGDAAAVRAVLDATPGPLVVCGHSYGGAVAGVAAAGHPRVRHLVFLAALVLDVGESAQRSIPEPDGGAPGPPSELGHALQVSDDGGTLLVDAARAREVFYADCAEPDVDRAVGRLGAQSTASFAQTATAAAWREIDSTYAVCTEDRAIAVWLQRAFAARATHVVEWPTSHSPFLSRPDLVVALLDRIARGAG
jgi:pimeloyl-ACP methyl ester carboxylesterase